MKQGVRSIGESWVDAMYSFYFSFSYCTHICRNFIGFILELPYLQVALFLVACLGKDTDQLRGFHRPTVIRMTLAALVHRFEIRKIFLPLIYADSDTKYN